MNTCYLLSIDPGRDTGYAIFDAKGCLLACGLGNPPDIQPTHLVAERPQVYNSGSARVDPNDLITLSIGLGRHLERFDHSGTCTLLVLPHAWKGTVPKPIHNRRVMEQLTPAERSIVESTKCAVSKLNNVIDAVGLGKWFFKTGRAR